MAIAGWLTQPPTKFFQNGKQLAAKKGHKWSIYHTDAIESARERRGQNSLLAMVGH
jgi:hypothetical protein